MWRKKENSLKYYESYQTENEFTIVLELCDVSLTEFKKNRKFSVIKYMKS